MFTPSLVYQRVYPMQRGRSHDCITQKHHEKVTIHNATGGSMLMKDVDSARHCRMVTTMSSPTTAATRKRRGKASRSSMSIINPRSSPTPFINFPKSPLTLFTHAWKVKTNAKSATRRACTQRNERMLLVTILGVDRIRGFDPRSMTKG